MIQAILLVALCALAASKAMIQGASAKHSLSGVPDFVLFNGVAFATSGLMLLPWVITNGIHPATAVFAAIIGVFSVVYQVTYVIAMNTGSVSLTVLINSFSMLIPVLVSHFLYGDLLGALRVVGIALTLVSLILNVRPDGGKINLRWLLFAFLAFASNGILSSFQKAFPKMHPELTSEMGLMQSQTFVLVSVFMLIAALVSAGMLGVMHRPVPAAKPRVILSAVLVGITLGAFSGLNNFALQIVPGTLLFPVENGGMTLLVSLASFLFLKERLSRRQWMGTAVGIAAIVLMSMG